MNNTKKALFAKPKHLGDTVILTSAIAAMPPGWVVDVYVLEASAELIRLCPRVSKVFFSERRLHPLRRFLKTISMLFKIKKEKYDLLVAFSDHPKNALLSLAAVAKVSAAILSPKRENAWWWRVAFQELVRPIDSHAAMADLSILNAVIETGKSLPPPYSLAVGRNAAEYKARQYSRKIIFQAASRWRFKQLPVTVVADFINHLLTKNYEIVLTGGPGDTGLNDQINAATGYKCGRFESRPFGDLLVEVESASFVISVDSFMVHFASAVGIPVLAIYGPTDSKFWAPWETESIVLSQANLYSRCMPCNRDGCLGTKRSDCLETLPLPAIKSAFSDLEESNAQKLASLL